MYTMKDVCDRTALPYETLRYYCNEGLIPNVKRDANNYRLFDDRDLAWLEGLQALRRCGLSIKDLKIYMNLALQGISTIPQRKIMLEKQKAELEIRQKEIETSLDYIRAKQRFYDDVLSGKINYVSNLINIE